MGGGYIAVECAGFLRGLGKKVFLVNRSTFLRSMDQDMSQRVVDDLEEDGVIVRTHSEVTAVELLPSGQKKVTLNHKNEVVVDTILVAIGRDPTTH